ncbi:MULTISPECIES: ABC transporter permease [unclassified Streptomyces]|uniref:ABC transporter permease n=1 Tax=unclassified Streptomyces TaxID=2593676 RepID=UPI00224DA75F|nr:MULTISPECIES: FtsX-like permease family protein [unclassified Streptomyces]MCX4527814.1 ABC transporter permease [Streptomyces sp. NBC_01551]MCX4541589.1 ABC transporter permease [Streptomyces sp. NBC_01565]
MSQLRTWARDLVLGARFAFAGGREGWTRTLLTGVGVGLGVALLLLTSAVPSALSARDERGFARETFSSPSAEQPGRDTLLTAQVNQSYRAYGVDGRLLQPEGPDAPLPPGLKAFPGPGEMAVSPALDRLMKSDEGKLLRERLDGKIVSTIGDAGLVGPGDLFFYAGTDRLRTMDAGPYVQRITAFGSGMEAQPLDPVLTLLVVLMFVALLMPVAVFIAAAVRFGGDRRDRRLAALRLVGADSRMVRRIAAGEALAGSLVGLAVGAGFFLIARQLADGVSVYQRSVFPHDLNPTLWLASLIALAVPAAAVAVTLFALRGVVIEPLGVVRTATPRRRRIWWRLLLPLAGLGLLAPMMGRGNEGGRFNQWQVSGGVVLLLVGITVLLPWILERVVGRLGGSGSVSWQLAVRRLQLTSGSAARLVNGIAVAVAGAIALQMLFAGAEGEYTKDTGQDPTRASVSILSRNVSDEHINAIAESVARGRGVTKTVPLRSTSAAPSPDGGAKEVDVNIGSCAALSELATLPACKDGDVFYVTGTPDPSVPRGADAEPGQKLFVGNLHNSEGREPVAWTVPADARPAAARKDPIGVLRTGLLITPAAAPKAFGESQFSQVYVLLDPKVADGLELARNAAFKADPLATAMTLAETETSGRFSSIRTGLFVGATLVLVLIGASLLVSQLEQLRERKKLLSSLVAFGTKRSTLSLSVLWQTALPIGLGLALASTVGIALGAVLMRMTNVSVRVDWASVASMAGIGAGVALAVTLLSLPPLLRLMRPDGLRTE